MKHKLLLLGAFLMASVSLSAQSYTANRTKVVPEFTDWAMEDTCYLWNVGSEGFYCNHQGPNAAPYWHTRAIACDTLGHKVVFTRNNPAGTEEPWESDGVTDYTCLLVSYVGPLRHNQNMCTFAEGWNGIWTDNNSNAFRYFNVVPKASGYINIERNMMLANGTTPAEEGKYLGILATDPDRTLKLHDTEEYLDDEENTYYNVDPAAEFWEDWAVVSPDAYDAWVAAGGKEKGKEYLAAASLKRTLEKAYADNPGINLDAPLAVYNNESATEAELLEAQASIPALVVEFLSRDASVDNPRDFTSAIVNSTFDTIGDFTGWSSGFGAGGATSTCAEVWRNAFDVHQDLVGLPEGVYMLTCNGYCRYNDNHVDDYNYWKAGNLSNAKLYFTSEANGTFSTSIKTISEGGSIGLGIAGAGNNVTATLTDEDGNEYEDLLYTPNSMLEADGYFHDESNPYRYYNEVFGALGEGETMRIGVKNESGADWNIFDDFKLVYYGKGEDAYKYWGNKMASKSTFDFDGSYYGKPDKDAYDAAIASLKSATTKDQVIENIKNLETATDNVKKSRTNYQAFVNAYNEALDWLTDAEEDGIAGKDFDKLSDYLVASAEDWNSGDIEWEFPNGVVNAFLDLENGAVEGKLSSEEIATETEYLLELKKKAVENGMVDGTNVTSLIVNPGFEEAGGKGWSLDTSAGGTSSLTNWHGGNSTNYCAEAYQQKFDVYQIINNVPNGLYEVSVQAYYRDGTNDIAWDKYLEGSTEVPTYVYFNEFATPVRNVMEITYDSNLSNNCASHVDDEGNTVYTLNGMASASEAFSIDDDEKNFTMKVYGLVTDGTIRLGIRNLEQDGGYTWSLWDNFKLIYRAKNSEALSSVIENYLERYSDFDPDGCGMPEINALATAAEKAESYIGASDGDAMMDALTALSQALTACNKSKLLYIDALDLLETTLPDALSEYGSTASQEAIDNASLLIEKYENLAGYEMNNDQVAAAIEEMLAAVAALKIPAIPEDVSDDNPLDMTSMIVNPSYEDGTADGWSSGHEAGGESRADMNERYMKTFDHNQTLKNLPAGTYELTLNCFNRIPGNNAQQDLDAFEEGRKNEVSTAFVYVKVGDQTYAEPFRMVSEGAREEWTLSGGYNTVTSNLTGMPLYTPNTMVAAGACFEETDWETGEPLSDELNYVVRVVFTLDEQSDVTIGCMNTSDQTWCCWDNWTLSYFGTESQKKDSGDATGVAAIEGNASVVATEIYNVGGARVATMQRGLNIVKMSDGSFRKVFVK